MKILWVGPFFSDFALATRREVNQAASKWSRGLLSALSHCPETEIRVLSSCSAQRWPRGKVVWQDANRKWFLDWFPCEGVGYCNVAGIKATCLKRAYAARARKLFKTWRPDIVLCYNSLHAEHVAVMREAARLGIKSVPIILDGDDPREDNWKWLLRGNRYASGIVFLSYWVAQNYPNQSIPILHMDGGADGFKGAPPLPTTTTKTYNLVHTGALDYWRGLDFMRRVIKCCKRQDVRFVFCGKCDKAKMWAAFDNDPRVEIKGFLSNEEVDSVCRSADVFLNVREPSVGDNILNYPSKVPNYLAYGKPVVSTWIDSFSPDYRDILDVCDNTPDGFVHMLDRVLTRTDEQRGCQYNRIKTWFCNCKSWAAQARRLIGFLEKIYT